MAAGHAASMARSATHSGNRQSLGSTAASSRNPNPNFNPAPVRALPNPASAAGIKASGEATH